jgi:hypothetical protein
LIGIRGHFAPCFFLDEKARSLDTAGDGQGAHRSAQAHIDGVGRYTEDARDVLGGHVLVNKAQAVALPFGKDRKVDWWERWPCCHRNTPPRWGSNVKRIRQFFIKSDTHPITRPCPEFGSIKKPLRIFRLKPLEKQVIRVETQIFCS